MSDLPSAEKTARDALALLEVGAAEAALQRVRAALAADPQCSLAHWIHALVLDALGRHEEALAAFAACANDMWANSGWHAQRVTCLISLNRADEALAAAADGLEVAPASATIWCSKGNALACAARVNNPYTPDPQLMKGAKWALLHAIELDPSIYSARVRLGWIYLDEASSNARRMIDEALAIRFGHPDVHKLAAAYCLRTGALDEAEDHIDVVASAQPAARDTAALILSLKRARSSFIIRSCTRIYWNARSSRKTRVPLVSSVLIFGIFAMPFLVDAGATIFHIGPSLFFLIILPLVGWHLWNEHQFKRATRPPVLTKEF